MKDKEMLKQLIEALRVLNELVSIHANMTTTEGKEITDLAEKTIIRLLKEEMNG